MIPALILSSVVAAVLIGSRMGDSLHRDLQRRDRNNRATRHTRATASQRRRNQDD